MAGTTFDATKYPALNLYLGTNKVPSRYDHNRPSDEVTIDNFDTTYTTENTAYEVQNDGVMYFSATGTNGNSTFIIVYIKSKNSNSYKQICTAGTYGGAVNYGSTTLNVQKGDKVYITAKNGGTTTTVYAQWYTHPLFIKATSIASDSDKDSILAQIQAYNTYSTEETLTGKTWRDGKPIYRKCFIGVIASNAILVQNVSAIVNVGGTFKDVNNNIKTFPLEIYDFGDQSQRRSVTINSNNDLILNCYYSNQNYDMWVEYTKTTD